jgi:hypothetical protein
LVILGKKLKKKRRISSIWGIRSLLAKKCVSQDITGKGWIWFVCPARRGLVPPDGPLCANRAKVDSVKAVV